MKRSTKLDQLLSELKTMLKLTVIVYVQRRDTPGIVSDLVETKIPILYRIKQLSEGKQKNDNIGRPVRALYILTVP